MSFYAMLKLVFGLQCTESAIRAASASRSGTHLEVQLRTERPLKKGVIAAGDVLDHVKMVHALRAIRFALKGVSKKAMLCLSPRVVHTLLLRIPRMQTGVTEAVHEELSALLPGSIENYAIQYTPLLQDRRGMRIAVTAVPADVLAAYKAACKEARLSLGRVTTSARALGSMLNHVDTFLLVNAADSEPSIVVFYGGEPIDELLLSSVTADSVIAEVQAILKEFREDDMPVLHVAVHGTKDLYAKIAASLEPKRTPQTRRKEVEAGVTVEHVLPQFAKDDLPWGGVIASSLGQGKDVSGKRKGFSGIVLQYFLVGIATIALVQFVWTLWGGKISEFWILLEQMIRPYL